MEESLSERPHSEQAVAVLNDAGVDIDLTETIRELEEEMLTAANNLEFEKAALLRDQIRELKRGLGGAGAPTPPSSPVNYRKSGRRSRASRK